MSKADRIRRLVPYAEQHRLYIPKSIHRTTYDGKTVDLINALVEEEIMGFPVGLHDDALDAISRLFDTDLIWPKSHDLAKRDRYSDSK